MDILLNKFFEPERWEEAIETGVEKGIKKAELRSLCSPEVRAYIYERFKAGTIDIAPPHEAQVPKDDGTMRIVYSNEGLDRILLSIANNLLFDMFPDMVHPKCKSYQRGIGTGKVVRQVVREIGKHKGWKADLSKYFDSVPRRYIDGVFDEIEKRVGVSELINWLRRYYHLDYVIDLNGELVNKYTSLKQGCAVAAFLADVVLYHIDERLSKMGVYYRYSDDIIFIGERADEALQILREELEKMELKLNPKKVEMISADRWFKFLGFKIKGNQITLSESRVKTFQEEIDKRTVENYLATPADALNAVIQFLYIGDGQYSWATSALTIINVQKDINTLNGYVLDALRATMTDKRKIGGLGSVNDRPDYTILRGRGRNVSNNRKKAPKEIAGYISINCMRNALLTDRAAYETLVRQL